MPYPATLFLKAISATFSFGQDSDQKVSREINIQGRLENDCLMGCNGVLFLLRVVEVPDNFKYEKINNSSEKDENNNEKLINFGDAKLLLPGKYIKEKTIELGLILTFAEFSKLKEIILNGFFAGILELFIQIEVIGIELGFEPHLNELPPEQYLPVVGYKFVTCAKKES